MTQAILIGKLQTFLVGVLVRKDECRCTSLGLFYDPSDDYRRDESVWTWTPPEDMVVLCANNAAYPEGLARTILALAISDAHIRAERRAATTDKQRFFVRAQQLNGGCSTLAFTLSETIIDGKKSFTWVAPQPEPSVNPEPVAPADPLIAAREVMSAWEAHRDAIHASPGCVDFCHNLTPERSEAWSALLRAKVAASRGREQQVMVVVDNDVDHLLEDVADPAHLRLR